MKRNCVPSFLMTSLMTSLMAFPMAMNALAQEKIVVPLSDPGQPATVKVRLVLGGITVTASPGKDVIVEQDAVPGRPPARPVPPPPPGMHRIDAPVRPFEVEEDHNTVTITSSDMLRSGDLKIQVPAGTSLQLRTISGSHTEVSGLSGDVEVENTNGSILLKNLSGAISAHTINGQITAELEHPSPEKPLSFSSLSGRIDVTLPGDTKARLRIKSSNGAVFSDFDVRLEPDSGKPVIEDGRGQGGKYRIRLERSVYGSINGGGPEYAFQTMNGNILIHRK